MDYVKSIDELYEEVKDYDFVLCNDAPLATALNNRLDKAQLGLFAITPRQFAAQKAIEFFGKPILDDIRLVKEVSNDAGLNLKYTHGEIENFKMALRFTREPRTGPRSRRVWDVFKDKNTIEYVLLHIDQKAQEFFAPYRVAVIGLDFFDELDKHVIPQQFDEIDIIDYTKDFSIESIRILGNDRQIAECAADLAKKCAPTDVAIVIDTGGPIADCVKSALYREKIPFINSVNIRDISSVRTYLEFLQLALSFDTVKVKDVREIISAYGGEIYHKYDNYYLSKVHDSNIELKKNTRALLDAMADVRNKTFREMCECVPAKDRSSVSMLINQMYPKEPNKKEAFVEQKLLDEMIYAVNNIGSLSHNEEIPDEEKKGVLLVDCKNSVFIDRPVVIYTGMSNEWATELSNIDYIDSKKIPDIEERYARRFNALIQQGSVRYYFVNATKEGKEAVPCRYFDECIHMCDPEADIIKSFTQICTGEPIRGPWEIKKTPRSSQLDEDEIVLSSEELPESFSKSSYNDFVACPKQFMFSRLTDSSDSTHTYLGTRIHDYAEFRVSYPEIAKQNSPEYYAELIAADCASLNSPDLVKPERSKIVAAVRAIDRFIESMNIEPGELMDRSSEKEDNIILLHHGLEKVSEHSEREITSRDLGMHGILDLIWNGIVFDFKTGEPNDTKEILNKMSFKDLDEGKVVKGKEFQPLLYLCLLEQFDQDCQKSFKLLYTQKAYNQLLFNKGDDFNDCIETVSVCDDNSEIVERYESRWAKEINNKLMEPVVIYRKCVEIAGDDPTAWPGRGDIVDEVVRYYNIGNGGKVLKGDTDKIKKMIADLSADLSSDYLIIKNDLIIRSSILEEFKLRLMEDLKKVRQYFSTTFPTKPAIDCKKCNYRDMCTTGLDIGGEADD